MKLTHAIAAWGTPAFPATLQAELEQLDPDLLPLQQGLSQGSHVSGDHFRVTMIAAHDEGDAIRARIGIHYQSVVAGCSCADDPVAAELDEYCQAAVIIEKRSASASITLFEP